jgi:hypothetical protein
MRMSRRMCLSFQSSFNPNTDISYTGNHTAIDDGDGNWRVKFTSSGTLTFLKSPKYIDVFLVGGGGGNNYGGGGGGYILTQSSVLLTKDTEYPIVIGAGGAGESNGENTTVAGYTANGGKTSDDPYGGDGGDGGSGGGASSGDYQVTGATGGSNGANGGSTGFATGGTGQGATTKEFGETSGDLYSGGGGGYINGVGGLGGGGTDSNGGANTGGGAGGSTYARSGGSGIVIIRNHRA